LISTGSLAHLANGHERDSRPSSAVHDVIFVATENNTVYAFDADKAGAPLWSSNLTLAGETLQTASDYNNTRVPQIGITGTPVIDPASLTLYVVAAPLSATMCRAMTTWFKSYGESWV
jgi:hypothetical protein